MRSILLTTVSVEIVVLVVTGIALYFVYVPTQSHHRLPVAVGTVLWWLVVHALVLTPVLFAFVALAIRRGRRPRTPST